MARNKGYPNNVGRIAFFVSLSCVLQTLESCIPHPIPGLRLGLANVLTLIVLVKLGLGHALEVSILRTLLSSFIMGTFISAGFILSFSGALVSTLIMGFFYWLSHFSRRYRLSIVGISILGALSHSLTQLYLAYFILVKNAGIFVFLPWLGIGAVVMGWVTGIAAAGVCLRLNEVEEPLTIGETPFKDHSAFMPRHYQSGNSFLHKLPAEIKILGVLILSLAVLIFNSYWFYLGLFFIFLALAQTSRVPFGYLLARTRGCAFLALSSFLFPVFLGPGRHVLSNIGYLKITSEGLSAGALLAYRVVFLFLLSSLLSRTTSSRQLSVGLARLLSALRPWGISGERVADIFSWSWLSIPVFWEAARRRTQALEFNRLKNPRSLISFLVDFINGLYLEAKQLDLTLRAEAVDSLIDGPQLITNKLSVVK